MPGKGGAHSSSISEQTEELRRKIQLLEGDRKAYYENSQWTIQQNKEKIKAKRDEIKQLRRFLADKNQADTHVVNNAFKEHQVERNEYRNKTGNDAIRTLDSKVRDRVNVLNKMKYKTTKMQKRLEELQTQNEQMEKDAESAADTDAGDSPEAQHLRNLENRLDKANLKCKEAEHIRKTYCQIKSKLEEEHQSFETTLDEMEQEIQRLRAEQKDLKAMHNDAVISRDAAQSQLRKEEQDVYAERKKRELELQKVKKEAEEKKALYEKIERRQAARSGSISQDELTPEQKQLLLGEDEAQQIAEYEEAFKRIKEATGVSDTQEVVHRFENQGDTGDHLEDLKKENEKTIFRLKEEKEKLRNEFEEMKYSGEAKLSSGQRLLEEFETHLKEEEQRQDTACNRLEKSSKILTNIKSGVEHLSEKLKHLKAASSQVGKSKISPTSDEYVLDQLSLAEEKLLKLLEDLEQSGKDIQDLEKQMNEEEFSNRLEDNLPKYNTRVKLPTTQKDDMFNEDEEESGEDMEVMTREMLKKQSQQLVDSKNKKRMPRKKKKNTKN